MESLKEDMAECMVQIAFLQRVAHPGRRGRIRILSAVRLVPARLASRVVASSYMGGESRRWRREGGGGVGDNLAFSLTFSLSFALSLNPTLCPIGPFSFS
jgi:hypothetical protein